jgi:hypothetical protein
MPWLPRSSWLETRQGTRRCPLPAWLQPGYDGALQELAATGAAELAKVRDPETVRSILATLAVAKGARVYGKILLEFSEDEVMELQTQAFGESS